MFREKCDSLLVEIDIIFHLWAQETPSISSILKKRGTVQQVLYSPMLSFFKMYGVVASVCVVQKIPHCDGSIVVFDGFWIKTILYKN